MSDYNTGTDCYASAGLQYAMSGRWSTKFGTIFEKSSRNNLQVALTYVGRY